jgi:hypothetical protein
MALPGDLATKEGARTSPNIGRFIRRQKPGEDDPIFDSCAAASFKSKRTE